MKRILIKNATIVNEGKRTIGSVVIENETIAEIHPEGEEPWKPCQETIDATGCYLLPGVIDEHVHFREPGLTQKGDIESESRAAAAGGVTSVMDMPNNIPLTTNTRTVDRKLELFNKKSHVNYSCYLGATTLNHSTLKIVNPYRICGIKLFMGSSTGDMLVDGPISLERIFNSTDLLIATHCENQKTIHRNTKMILDYVSGYLAERPTDLNLRYHNIIRSREACFSSTELAISLAMKTGARLHVMHISTQEELKLFRRARLEFKKITAEACIPHLLFTEKNYKTLGTRIKCNPAIKETADRTALRLAINKGRIDTIATDHAPHLLSDKVGGALKAASGMPMIQFSLVAMLGLVDEGVFTIEKIVEKMCHAPAQLYQVNNRGYIRKGYQADLVLVRPGQPWILTPDLILSKCKWSPLEGKTFNWRVEKTFVNGKAVFSNGEIDDTIRGQELCFTR